MNTIALEIGEKILNDINIAFDNDDSIDELGFVMDKEPSIICIEHKLGMTLGSLKPLFIYCSYKLNELMKIGISSLLDDDNNNDSNNHDNYNDILLLLSHITRGLLLVRGDYPPAFAYRKKMITLGVLSINTELNFLKMLFAQHPKSPSSWQHRRWCLMTKDEMIVLSSDDIEVELSLCTASAESYPKNYYAWMHRLWLLQYMKYDHLMKELGFCDAWLLAHVSDHSAVSHKHQVLKRVLELITTSDDKLTMLFNILTKNENSLLLRPGNEALWYDRRGIMLLLLNEGSQLNPKRWKLLYTKRMPQYINDFNNCQEFRINECVDSDNYKTNIDDINNIVLETWAKDNVNNYCDVYHKTAINTKVVLETLIHLLSTNNSNDDTLLDNFMILLIQSEVLLCRHCSIDENAWNYEKQRQQSLRYISFLYYKIMMLCNTSVNDIDTKEDDAAFWQLRNLTQLSQSISDKDTNSMLNIIIKGLKGILLINTNNNDTNNDTNDDTNNDTNNDNITKEQ